MNDYRKRNFLSDEKNGSPTGPLDMMIASHAKSLDYTIVTNNVKEFERVDGLKLENRAV